MVIKRKTLMANAMNVESLRVMVALTNAVVIPLVCVKNVDFHHAMILAERK